MSGRRALPWVIGFLVLALVGGGVLHLPARDGGTDDDGVGRGSRLQATVVWVVDGDTIKVRIGGRRDTVRYIGIDTPESVKPNTPVQCFAEAASARNKALVSGRRVTLVTDAEPRDRYGRLLAYVYRAPDGLFVNAALVRSGFARILTLPPNISHVAEFLNFERRARRQGLGLWAACA